MNAVDLRSRVAEFMLSSRKTLQQLLVVVAITKTNIMPLAPFSTALPCAQNPKIDFSIDSIVSSNNVSYRSYGTKFKSSFKSQNTSKGLLCTDNEHNLPSSPTSSPEPFSSDIPKTALLDINSTHEILDTLSRIHPHHQFINNNSIISNGKVSPQRPLSFANHLYHRYPFPLFPHGNNNSSANSHQGLASLYNISATDDKNTAKMCSVISSNNGISPCHFQENHEEANTQSVISSPPSTSSAHVSRCSSPHDDNCRICNPTMLNSNSNVISQPLTAFACHPPQQPLSQHPYLPPVGPQGLPQFASFPQGMINFAAAAAAAAFQHPGLVGPHPPPNPAAAHPLYPWLLAKNSRLFPHCFGPGPALPGFLLQAFRKPKRIRTAFSPSQLLKLEHAFERSHYVVGAERKQLANSLSLSETQVKVWFQNRRTKHKRMQQEDEIVKKSESGSGGACGNGSHLPSSAISADSSTRYYSSEGEDDDKDIIMDDEYLDQEEEISEQLNQRFSRST